MQQNACISRFALFKIIIFLNWSSSKLWFRCFVLGKAGCIFLCPRSGRLCCRPFGLWHNTSWAPLPVEWAPRDTRSFLLLNLLVPVLHSSVTGTTSCLAHEPGTGLIPQLFPCLLTLSVLKFYLCHPCSFSSLPVPESWQRLSWKELTVCLALQSLSDS